eukprot:2134764-Amphidinium_carterae.1
MPSTYGGFIDSAHFDSWIATKCAMASLCYHEEKTPSNSQVGITIAHVTPCRFILGTEAALCVSEHAASALVSRSLITLPIEAKPSTKGTKRLLLSFSQVSLLTLSTKAFRSRCKAKHCKEVAKGS